MRPYDKVTGTIKIRELLRAVKKPGVDSLTGLSDVFDVMFSIDEGIYAGEFALAPTSESVREKMMSLGISWIASGDLVIQAP